ncbi:MAG: M1 family metallopeptidase, partial [Actinomycetota bacterium]|nr:M1 family metallopeptidase [Actinomycetota bacterium]
MNKNILPKTSAPKRYEIKLDVDLENFSYVGTQTVEIQVLENTKSIFLNSLGIKISHASLITSDEESYNLSVEYFEDNERISLSSQNEIKKGDYKLYLEFNSEITNDLKGFYRSKFLTKEDEEKWIATTQFEPTSARNAFPCWDEPEYKAVFSISIIADEKYLRVSNEKVLSEKEIDDNKVETTFVDSMKMSTYLVAFVIGELEATEIGDAGNTKVRIVHRPGFSDQTNYAGTAGIELLNFFEDYYKIPYPGSKLDLIAIPDFAMGAMENVGAVTFRENLLLIDEEKATRPELNRSVTVIAHELAHMWFGDLVTMKWWDGIWLNEAFASLMEVIAADNKYPEFKLWNEMNLSRSAGFAIDSLENSRPIEFEVETPEEAEEMFDVLTYEKGSTVLRMFEVFIGEGVFQKGVQEYLNKFKYDNTNSSDLWDSLSKASGQPLNEMLPYWIKEKGYPSVNILINNSSLLLEQKRFLLKNIKIENSNKPIPISIKFLDTDEKLDLILDQTSEKIDIEEKGKVPLVNSGGWGFYHVFYDEKVFNEILNNFEKLDQ